MRASPTAVVLLMGVASLLSGCDQAASPTSPTSAPSFATSGPSVGVSLASSPLAVPADVPHQVPFKGTFEGSDTVVSPTITTRAGGTGTHVGRFSFTNVITFPARTGVAHWVTANGDSIESTSVSVSSVLGPVVRTNTESHTITGGTGRFSGAQGNFIVVRTHVLIPSADGTHVTAGSFEGTITSPGAAR